MSEAGQRALARTGTARALHLLDRVHAWRARRSPAAVGTPQALAWMVAIATLFVLMSNPLVLLPNFFAALDRAIDVTWVICLVTLPWLRLPLVSIPVGLFMAFAGLTTLWSISEVETRGSTQMYVHIALIALLAAANTRTAVLCHGVTLGGVAVVVLSYWAQLTGRMPPTEDGFLAGIGTNRNILAYTLVLALCFALAAVPRSTWGRVLWGLSLATILLGIYLAGSGTATAAAPALILVALALRLSRRQIGSSTLPRLSRRGWTAVWSVLLLASATLSVRPDLLGRLLGRDSTTLSGRVPFWRATLEELDDRVLQGYGWGTVWPHPWQPAWPNNVFDRIYFNAGYQLTHGHNSLIDLAPQVGLIGILAYLTIMAGGLRATLLVFRSPQPGPDDEVTARLAVLAVLGLVLCGITEPLSTIPLGWFCLVMVAGVAARTAREVRAARREGELAST
ncbi:O-antigen ligase family protein [Nocardioides campestrisoli]|uniref:O-antigen ligase family protein n=1 Tax=Nocardioides campestrisoli TaxID=2736757 RepID=UPI0015E68E58|nr:O-antigen ligase family protein [Nocardioides campestrisoli]